MTRNNPYGDEGGARVGKPDTPKRDNLQGGGDGGNLGAGKESTGDISKYGNPGGAEHPAPEPPGRKEGRNSGGGGKAKRNTGQK
jgi:hypothetical protein